MAQNSTYCPIPGDADVLGLGVRLGFYLQLFSNLLLGTVCPGDAAAAFLPNLYFILALICAAIYSSATENFPPGSIIACTWYPLMAYVALLPFLFRWHDRLPVDLPPIKLMALASVVAVASGFSTWFWYKGLNDIHPDQCMEPRVFVIVNLSALGNARTLFKVLAPLGTVIALASGYSTWWFEAAILSKLGALPDQSPYVPSRRIRVCILGLVWLAVGIVASELQLSWNHVAGVNSVETTGQIIPLTLGILSFVQTLIAFRAVFKKWAMKIASGFGKLVRAARRFAPPRRRLTAGASTAPAIALNQIP